MFFSSDTEFGCVDDSLFFIRRVNGVSSLHKLSEDHQKNYLEAFPARGQALQKAGEANLQAAWWLQHGREK